MPQLAQTSYTLMTMFDHNPVARKAPMTLVHAGEVAHWAVVLFGWIWMGEQGMLSGSPVVSGLLPVVVWWAVRLICRGSSWAFQCHSLMLGLLGLVTAMGAWIWGLMASRSLSQEWLLVLAVVWGAWIALIETRTRRSTFQLGKIAWHPVVAAALAIFAWQTSDAFSIAHLGAIVLLAVCSFLLYWNDRFNSERKQNCHGIRTSFQSLLVPSAMGLMMGSLWLNNAWCVAIDLQTDQMVMIHLSLMAGLPTLASYLILSTKFAYSFYALIFPVCLALLSLGAVALLGDGFAFEILAMLLPSLAWALHCSRPRFRNETVEIALPWLAKCLALLLGPALLLWVGILSPVQGPMATKFAFALLGALAFLKLLHLWWREQFLKTHLSG
jgi:uncharacterized membrane protein YsdA (DUF1294 family)